MSSEVRSKRIREKFELDRKHFQYLIAKGWHPLEIASQMTDNVIQSLRESVKLQHPDWNETQILDEMREKILFNSKMQKKRGLREFDRS